jgi:dTDP-4-dehydrorhamnose reductase
MKVLLFGGSGMLGSDVQSVLKDDIRLYCPSRVEVDITDTAQVDRAVAEFKPDVIVNCAAYTDVEGAEENPEAAWNLNVHAVANLALGARRHHVRLIHLSTDYVFDGESKLPLSEQAACNPLSVYGRTKRAGELACLSMWPDNSLVVRTSWLFGGTGPNFVSTMLRLGSSNERLKVIADQTGSPTYTRDLARCIRHMMDLPHVKGILHASNAGTCSWHEFAEAIFKGWSSLGHEMPIRVVEPIPSTQWPTKARRPHWSALSLHKLESEAGYTMPHWETALSDYLAFRSSNVGDSA